ncbi:glycosyltransferase family 2 protein [Bacillus bingmayongensis]|uniref:glycosyltransferase family 2 protein n=1 Tax=Bacillus bingmayongensis TaxID=1150157 RepID=UPI0002D5B87F|nr:glycosyltransferase family 2 protein [Bacillus bingmayongensis]MBY0600221.1 glycosyltransferase [Bacillus bingmayongensis]
MNPKVSIILTSYNKPVLVGKAIESVLGQSLDEWELFIMDDNSNEETIHVIKQYLGDSRIVYMNSTIKDDERYQKTRYAVLINKAIPLTRGTYISYLTDDTVYVPERLEEMTSFLIRNPKIDIVYSSQQVKFVDYQLKLLYERVRSARSVLSKAANIVDHCSVMHTRSILEAVYEEYGGYWDESPVHWYNGDAAFWERLNGFQAFHPIDKILDITYKTPYSFQNLYNNLPMTIPNGTLVRGSSHQVFLIEGQQRRLITNEMLIYFKYDLKKIVTIPDPFLYRYVEGSSIDNSTAIPNLRVVQNEKNEFFYIENNKKRPIMNTLTFRKFKFSFREVIKVGSGLLDSIPYGVPISSILRCDTCLPESKILTYVNQYWIVMNCKLHPIDKKVVQKLNNLHDCIKVSRTEIEAFEKGEPIIPYLKSNLG